MKLIATLFELNRIKDVLTHADGIVIGHESFGTRLTQSFEPALIVEALEQANHMGKSLFLMANQLMDDAQLEAFALFIQKLPAKEFTGIIVADIGAVMTLKMLGLGHLAIYHPETLHTNAADFNFLSQLGIKGAFVAKEILLEDIVTIGKHKAYDLFMTGHGHLNMFYSKRHLIENYTQFASIKNQYVHQQNLKVIESERPDEPYPIFEDLAGTHVFRHHVLSSHTVLEQLKPYVDYMIIDTLFKDDDYAIDILKLYRDYKDDQVQTIQNKYQELWDTGFYHKKTIYKK
ncbi:MAG: peptidase U32 family protein [Acholeplasmataceae bacterium]